jgi:hypothetical protein
MYYVLNLDSRLSKALRSKPAIDPFWAVLSSPSCLLVLSMGHWACLGRRAAVVPIVYRKMVAFFFAPGIQFVWWQKTKISMDVNFAVRVFFAHNICCLYTHTCTQSIWTQPCREDAGHSSGLTKPHWKPSWDSCLGRGPLIFVRGTFGSA